MQQLQKVVVTGIGPVSAVGCGRDAYWQALTQGETGFAPISLFDASNCRSKVAAEVKDFQLGDFIPRGKALSRMHGRPSQFAMAATALALEDSGLSEGQFARDRAGVAIGTGLANLEVILKTWNTFESSRYMSPIAAYQVFHHNIACVLTSMFDFRGSCHTLSSGCNSGIDALGYGLRQIQTGDQDILVCVGTDCEVVEPIMAALDASGSLATKFNDEPSRASRPFDKNRDGNVVGEGACCLILESEKHAEERGANIYASFDAYSLRSAGRGRKYSHDNPDVDMSPSVAALRTCLQKAGLEKPDVISANGSSSVRYDLFESQAYQQLLGEQLKDVPLHSIKSMLGQHGAGTSALQAAAACLSLHTGQVPGTVNCENQDANCGPLKISGETSKLDPKSVLIHAIGLGGFYYSAGVFGRV